MIKTESIHPDNLVTISQKEVQEIRVKLDELNIGDKITLTLNSLGGQFKEQARIKSKTYQQGHTDEKFGSWGMNKNKFNPIPRYILEATPKKKQRIFLFPIGSRIIDFRIGW